MATLLLLPLLGWAQPNNWRYDLRRFNLGFTMGLNIADVKTEYQNPEYNRHTRQGFRKIEAHALPGLNIGMITNTKIWRNFDLRFIPAVSLTQRNFDYFIGQDSVIKRKLEASYIELPLLIKFKSNFYAHHRIYVATGIKYTINLVSDKKVRDDPNLVRIEKKDFSWEFAFGIDIYGDRVKLSPEIRYSMGLYNVYVPNPADPYMNALHHIISQQLTLSLHFE